MRSWKYFNKEEATKFAKGNLALQNIPLTEENIKSELDNVYTEWLWLKTNDTMREKNEIIVESESNAIYYQLKAIPTKYYPIILQWLYDEPIHYEGKYFTFEEIYNKVNNILDYENISLNNKENLDFILKNIYSFDKYEIEIEKKYHLTSKELQKYKEHLVSTMFGHIFEK